MDCEAPSLRGFAPYGRISPDACGGTKWTAKPPLSGDLLPTVAFPLPPAAGQNGLRSPLSQGICSLRSHFPCRLRRALQKGTKMPLEQALRHLRSLLRREGDSNPRNPQGVQQFSRLFNSFRDCPVRPLRHLSFSILDANITANFQFHQNFNPEFCNVKIIIHICRRRGAVTSRGSPTAQ